jgi:hypothetical protein
VNQLVTYLDGFTKDKPEDFGYVGRMSVMFGTIMHEVNRQALYHLGLMVPVPSGICMACGLMQPRLCREHGVSQPETRSRGHLDGILYFGPQPLPQTLPLVFAHEHIWGFDLKTIKNVILGKAPDMDEAFFRERWPAYWWQVQEYMRLTGLSKYIVLFQGIGNPWDLREYHIQADPAAAYEIETKYLNALARAGAQ